MNFNSESEKGKTEWNLLETAQRNTMHRSGPLDITISHTTPTIIKKLTEYTYLGVQVDSSLALESHFDKCFKRASSRLGLVAKLGWCIDIVTASTIYRAMILLTFTLCGILHMNPQTQK